MHSFVQGQLARLAVPSAAGGADERLLSRMKVRVFDEVLFARKLVMTLIADVSLGLEVVAVHMPLQVELGVVGLPALWGHAAVYHNQIFRHMFII